MAIPEKPESNVEKFLAAMLGQEVELPEGNLSRVEQYLKEIYEHGSGGGMNPETYDPDGSVAEAGGIPAYVEENAPVTSVNGRTGDVELVPSDLGIGMVFQLKGSKATVVDLPASGNTIGDVWYVTNESVGYIWLNDGTTDRWEQLGLPIDLSNYYTKTETDAEIAADIAAIPTKPMVVTYDDDTTETFNVLTRPTE